MTTPSRRLVLLALLPLAAAAAWQTRTQLLARAHRIDAREALQRDDPAAAQKSLRLCLATWPHDGEANFLAAQADRRGGDLVAARRHLQVAEDAGRPADDLAFERDLMAAQSGRHAEVEAALLKRLAEGHPESVEVISVLLPVFMAEFRLVQAEALTARWVELRPDSAKAWGYHADVLERVRKKSPAVAALRRQVELAPDDARACLNLARLLLECHDPPDEAAGHLERLVATDPGDPAVLVQLAACREAQGRPDEAAALLDRVIAGPGGDAKALHARGRLEMQRGQPAAARDYLRRAAELDPSDIELMYTAFLCTQQTGTPDEVRAAEQRYSRAKADMQRVAELARTIDSAPRDPNTRREMGELFLRNAKTYEGLRWLGSALEIDPRHAATHSVLAGHYGRAGRPDLAQRHAALAAPAAPPK